MTPIKTGLSALAALICMAGCRPKPIDITVAQQSPDMAISSMAYDAHTVFISAGYTISSFTNLLDTARRNNPAGKGNMVDSGLVILSAPGRPADTLQPVSPGLYGRRDLELQDGTEYTLLVQDRKRGKTATAATRFYQMPVVDTLVPVVLKKPSDTVVKVHITIRQVQAGNYFLVHYTTSAGRRPGMSPYSMDPSVLQSYSPKNVELLDDRMAAGGVISRDIILNARATDTLYIQCSRIGEHYARYLEAYKRMGDLINQFTGEPIHLPTNISAGFGYFSLSLPVRHTYLLKHY